MCSVCLSSPSCGFRWLQSNGCLWLICYTPVLKGSAPRHLTATPSKKAVFNTPTVAHIPATKLFICLFIGLFVGLFIGGAHLCPSTLVEVRESLVLPYGAQGENSGHPIEPLSTELSCHLSSTPARFSKLGPHISFSGESTALERWLSS